MFHGHNEEQGHGHGPHNHGFGGRMERKRMIKHMLRAMMRRGFGPQPDISPDDPFWGMPRGRGGPGGPFGGPFGPGGPFGGNPFGEDGGGRQRQRRGDIKLALLELLAAQPRHGYELIKELEQRYGGFYRPSPGSVYPTLQLLEDEGNLTSEQVEGKRIYTITEAGRQLLATQHERRGHGTHEGHAGPGWPHGPGRWQELGELRQRGMALVESVMQVARHGTPAQIDAVMGVLDNTRREIYKILSAEGTDKPEQGV